MKKRGFTLVELLAVIGILAVILILAVPKVNSYILSSRKQTFINNALNIARQLEYDNMDFITFDKAYLKDFELDKLNRNDIDINNSLVYVEDNEIYIDLVGIGSYEGFYVCHVNSDSKNVTIQNTECGTSTDGLIYIDFEVDLDGGDSTQKYNNQYASGNYLNLIPPKKYDLTFAGWEVVSGDSVISGNRIKFGTEATKIKALWKQNPLLIVNNEGTTTQIFKERYPGGTVIILERPTREGYVFAGWEVTSGNGVVSGNIFTMGSEDTTIKALWKADKVNINYNLNGGTAGASAPTEGKSGSTVTVSNPSKTGYTFIDWTISGTGASINDTSLTLGTSDVTLSANWTINTYQVDVNPVIDGTSYNSGLSGYTFDVWVNGSLVADDVTDWCQNVSYGSTVRVKTNNVTGRSTSFDSTITVGASNTAIAPSWSTNTYAISYTLNGGTAGSSAPTSGTYGSTVTISNPTRSGYAFAGWIVSGNGAVLSGNSLTIGEGDVTLTADWAKNGAFAYTGGEQSYKAIIDGYYKLEVWGAQGGNYVATDTNGYSANYNGGRGGYSTGKIFLRRDQTIYINVGGMGNSIFADSSNYHQGGVSGGYNGGGAGGKGASSGFPGGSGGGGATSIAQNSGLLSSLSNNKQSIIIVAGGAGGGGWVSAGGSGGGFVGVNSGSERVSVGGSQSSGYSFGVGSNGYTGNYTLAGAAEGSSGSGGGYYGGTTFYSSSAVSFQSVGGAGGSGYIGNSLLTDKYMYCYNCATSDAVSTKTYTTTCANETPTENCAKIGNGYAKITFVGKSLS